MAALRRFDLLTLRRGLQWRRWQAEQLIESFNKTAETVAHTKKVRAATRRVTAVVSARPVVSSFRFSQPLNVGSRWWVKKTPFGCGN
jgi:hypothetical protein